MAGSESKLTLVQDKVLLEVVIQLPMNDLFKNFHNHRQNRDEPKITYVKVDTAFVHRSYKGPIPGLGYFTPIQ